MGGDNVSLIYNFNKMKKQKHKTKDEILKEAQEILKKELREKQDVFLEAYKNLCIKHGMELVAKPMIQIAPIQNQ